LLAALPDKPEGLEYSTDDISFRECFHEFLQKVELEKKDGQSSKLVPRSHYRKESILKKPIASLEEIYKDTLPEETLGVDAVIADAGNVFRSRTSVSTE